MGANARPRVPFNDLARQQASVSAEVTAAVERVLSSGWYSLGPEVEAFEAEFAAFVGVPHAVGLASGTDALELALAALGCGPGDEVITAANAGGYTTIAALRLGASPRFADVEADSLALDPVAVTDCLTSRTRAVVVTHLYGRIGRVAELAALCASAGVALVEDCAQSVGASQAGQVAGSFGDVSAFSFYPTKNLGAVGDGGAVCMASPALANRARSLRQYGWGERYHVEILGGRNSRLDEIQAAILRAKLQRLKVWNCRRREIAQSYRAAVPETIGRVLGTANEQDVAHLAVVLAVDRESLQKRLFREGVDTSIHYPVPDHLQPAYRGVIRSAALPVTEHAAGHVLSLPCFPELTVAEAERVCAVVSG